MHIFSRRIFTGVWALGVLALIGCDSSAPPSESDVQDEQPKVSQSADRPDPPVDASSTQPAKAPELLPGTQPAESTDSSDEGGIPQAPPESDEPTPARADRKTARQLAEEGWKLFRQKKFDQAEALFIQAVETDSQVATAWSGLGWAQLNQGKLEEAEKNLHAALTLEPDHPGALNGLGWIARRQGNNTAAIEYWQKAISPDPRRATASLSGLASTYLDMGQYDKAIHYYRLWIQYDPTNEPAARAGLAKARAAAEKDIATTQTAPEPAPLLLNEANHQKEVSAVTGQTITVALKGNATTGYAWIVEEVTGRSVEPETLVTDEQGQSRAKVAYTPDRAPQGATGVGGTYSAVFEAVQPGTSTIRMVYRRPWENPRPTDKTFEVTVTVNQR